MYHRGRRKRSVDSFFSRTKITSEEVEFHHERVSRSRDLLVPRNDQNSNSNTNNNL